VVFCSKPQEERSDSWEFRDPRIAALIAGLAFT
jgi:hypothetical protein